MTNPTLDDIELLARLVAFDTTSHNSNLALVDFLADYLDPFAAKIDRNPSADGCKANLVVRIGPKALGDRAGLVLSGHVDVVPAKEEGWKSDPFTLTERDGRLYARGACDMKGFVALASNAAATLAAEQLTRPLVLLFTYDEEIGTLGARRFAETWPERDALPKSAIIGEPTSWAAVRTHKGFLEFRVTFHGQSAHSGYPHLGVNAIEPAARAIEALAGLRRELETERPAHADLYPEVPFVPLNVGRVTGGVASNVVPDTCTFDVSLRPLPEMDVAGLVRRIETAVGEAARGAPFTVERPSDAPPLYTAAAAPLYCAIREEMQQEDDVSVSYATDAGWLQTAGLECVIWGPGDIAVAHKPNESIPVAELRDGAVRLQRVVRRFCC